MDKIKINVAANMVTDKMQKRLHRISDHSKELEVRRSAISAIFVELFIMVIAYNYKFYSIAMLFAIIVLSGYHILRMFLQIKKKENRVKERVVPNAVISGFHLLLIIADIVIFIVS